MIIKESYNKNIDMWSYTFMGDKDMYVCKTPLQLCKMSPTTLQKTILSMFRQVNPLLGWTDDTLTDLYKLAGKSTDAIL